MREIAALHSIGSRTDVVMRIGMDVGPIVAGVIGDSRFLWDIYGETVNAASRMESFGVPGSIQVTDRVARLLAPDFELRDRGVIEVKGMGPVHTSFLEARRS